MKAAAIQKGQQAGVGLDQIRHFSRHRTLATMLIYRDEHDRERPGGDAAEAR